MLMVIHYEIEREIEINNTRTLAACKCEFSGDLSDVFAPSTPLTI